MKVCVPKSAGNIIFVASIEIVFPALLMYRADGVRIVETVNGHTIAGRAISTSVFMKTI